MKDLYPTQKRRCRQTDSSESISNTRIKRYKSVCSRTDGKTFLNWWTNSNTFQKGQPFFLKKNQYFICYFVVVHSTFCRSGKLNLRKHFCNFWQFCSQSGWCFLMLFTFYPVWKSNKHTVSVKDTELIGTTEPKALEVQTCSSVCKLPAQPVLAGHISI